MVASAAVAEIDPGGHGLGDELEAFLDHLGSSGLRIGPRERVAVAALTASLVTAGGAATLGDLAPMLAPLLARSPEERQTFARVLGAFTPDPTSAPAPSSSIGAAAGSDPPTPSSWWLPLALLGLLVSAVTVVILNWPAPTKPVVEIEKPAPARVEPARRADQAVEAPRPTTFESLGRIEKAAERFEGASRRRQLVVEDQRVEGDVTAHGAAVQLAHHVRHLVEREPDLRAGAEVTEAEVDGVGPGLHGGAQLRPVARRAHQFGYARPRAGLSVCHRVAMV